MFTSEVQKHKAFLIVMFRLSSMSPEEAHPLWQYAGYVDLPVFTISP